MSGFLNVERVVVKRELLVAAHKHLAAVGRKALECVVLWTGVHEGKIFRVHEIVAPAQTALRSEAGVCVRVEGAELHRLNVRLYETQHRLFGQVHTHPTTAYHSETDDAFPMVTTVGGISLVVPDYAAAPFNLDDYACYRLSAAATWDELTPEEVNRLIVIEG